MSDTPDAGLRYSVNEFVGDGTTTNWEFNFSGGYISRDHVKAKRLVEEDPLDFTWINDNTVRIDPPVPNGTLFAIYRDTPKEEPLADFTDGSILTEQSLDKNARQAVFIAAEAADGAQDSIYRALRVPAGETIGTVPTAALRAGKVIGFDSSGNLLVTVSHEALFAAANLAEQARILAQAAAKQAVAAVVGDKPVKEVSGEYIVQIEDRGHLLLVDSADVSNIYWPAGFPTGFTVDVLQWGTGAVYILADVNATVNSFNGQNKIAGRYGQATIIQAGDDKVTLYGNLNGTGSVGWIESVEVLGAGEVGAGCALRITVDDRFASGSYMGPGMFEVSVTSPVFNGSTTRYDTRTLYSNGLRMKDVPDETIPDAHLNESGKYEIVVYLTDYIYTEDTVTVSALPGWFYMHPVTAPGQTVTAVNHSPFAVPKSVATWGMSAFKVVGNTIDLEVIGFHREAHTGKDLEGVIFTVTDGTNTVTSPLITTPAISNAPRDRNAVISYKVTGLDISSLADETKITANAKVYGRICTPTSVLDSSTETRRNRLAPRYFWRSTSRAANPPICYVDLAATPGTGVCSTDPAVAAANPCATVDEALTACAAAFPYADGLQVRARAGVHTLTSGGTNVNRTIRVGSIVLTRDMATTTSDSDVVYAGNGWQPKYGTGIQADFAPVRFTKCTVRRTGTSGWGGTNFSGVGTIPVMFIHEDSIFDNNFVSNNYLGPANDQLWGVDILNAHQAAAGSTVFTAFGTIEDQARHYMFRGVDTVGLTNPSFPDRLEQGFIIGCSLTRTAVAAAAARPYDGSIVAFNRFHDCVVDTLGIGATGFTSVNGYAVVQNLFERISVNGASEGVAILRLAGDGFTANLNNIIKRNNTFVGAYLNGRSNDWYDETSGLVRTHTLISDKNNIVVLQAIKGQRFMHDQPDEPDWLAHIGNQPVINGVGVGYNWWQYGGFLASARPYNYGRGSVPHPTQSQTERNDPGFVEFRGMTYNGAVYTPGTPGGNYRIDGSGPARQIGAPRLMSHGLDGGVRQERDVPGCYA